jgi:hypothetical protein
MPSVTRASIERPQPSYTPYEFCEAERISRAMLYKLWQQGKGPRYFQVGNRRRITQEARINWQRQREAEAQAAKRSPNPDQIELEDAIASAAR